MKLKPSDLHVPEKGKKGFEQMFGETWESALAEGKVYNAKEACEKLGVDGEGLDKEWTQFVEDYITFDDVQIVSKKETINRDIFIDEKEAGDIKTLSELNIETNFYSNPERKMQKLEQRKLQSSFTGAAILDMQNVESIKSKIDLDPKEAYNKFLNNVDFRKIVLNSVKSLISEKVDSATDEILKETKKIENDKNIRDCVFS